MIALELFACAVFYVSACSAIFIEVKSISKQAQENFPREPVDALHTELAAKSSNYITKNEVIYALGQIGDESSLDALKKLWNCKA